MGDGDGGLPSLADTIAAVRRELSSAQAASLGQPVQFRTGSVELDFEVAVTRTGGGSAGVRVGVLTLDGKGMPADILNRFQKTGERAGVGLSGIRERVKELGGRVEISSDRDGTLLSVVLPLDLKREAEKERN